MRFNTLCLTLVFSALAHAGTEGHGAGGLLCKNSPVFRAGVFLIDLVEAETNGDTHRALSPALRVRQSQDSVTKQFEDALTRMSCVAPLFAEKVRRVYFYGLLDADEARMPLPPPQDLLLHWVAPAGCQVIGLGLYNDTKQKLTWVRRLVESMSPSDQAAFWFHEAVYKVLRELRGDEDSRAARRLTGIFFSEPLEKPTDYHYLASIDAGATFDPNTWSNNIWNVIETDARLIEDKLRLAQGPKLDPETCAVKRETWFGQKSPNTSWTGCDGWWQRNDWKDQSAFPTTFSQAQIDLWTAGLRSDLDLLKSALSRGAKFDVTLTDAQVRRLSGDRLAVYSQDGQSGGSGTMSQVFLREAVSTEFALYLIENDPSAMKASGIVRHAIKEKYWPVSVLKALVAHGAQIDVLQDFTGLATMDESDRPEWTCRTNSMIEYLKAKGFDLNQRYRGPWLTPWAQGATLAQFTAMDYNFQTLQIMLELGADLKFLTDQKWSMLHMGAVRHVSFKRQHFEVFINQGVNPCLRNADGKLALELMIEERESRCKDSTDPKCRSWYQSGIDYLQSVSQSCK